MSEAEKCPKCKTIILSKGGRKGEAKAVAKSLLTSQIKITYICPKCGYTEKSQTIIQK